MPDELDPSIYQSRLMKFITWNGDLPAPKFSHWTNQGTVTIRAITPLKTTEVLWRGQRIGFDDINPEFALRNLLGGNYDAQFGLEISKLVPDHLSLWNDL